MIRKPLPCLLFAAVLIASALPAQAEEKLYRRELTDQNLAGKEVRWKFEETKHDTLTSTAKLTVLSGIPSGKPTGLYTPPAIQQPPMLVQRAAYDMAVAREMAYFIKLSEKREEDGSYTFRFGFSNDPNADPVAYYQLKEPLPKDDAHRFQSVKQLEMLFKER